MNTLIIMNDAPYGSERSYNAVRLADSLVKQDDITLRLFLMGDGASCAHRGQKVPKGFYNIQQMLAIVTRHGGAINVCGTCMDARGLGDEELVDGARRSSMDELTTWTREADKVLVF